MLRLIKSVKQHLRKRGLWIALDCTGLHWIVDCGLWIVDCGLWIVGCGLWVVDCGLHWIALDCTGLHWIALDCTGLHWIAQDCTGLHRIALDCTGLHRIAQDCTGLHWIALDCTGLHWIALDCTGLWIVHPPVTLTCSRNKTVKARYTNDIKGRLAVSRHCKDAPHLLDLFPHVFALLHFLGITIVFMLIEMLVKIFNACESLAALRAPALHIERAFGVPRDMKLILLSRLEGRVGVIVAFSKVFKTTLTEPIAINLKSGKTENALALPGGTKRLLRDMEVSIQPVKRRASKGNDFQDSELCPALAIHAFGGLMDDDLCYRTFRKDGSDVAKQLAEALIQSGAAVLLALKVEVYGRSPTEDPHQQDVAHPISGSFIVQSLLHDGTTKILIGTQTWNALNMTVERQTRSKFDEPISIEPYAGVFMKFLAHKFLPVTLKALWDYFMG
ncbi:hypothetical protein KI688_007578 [Linnemannia hyalina]|uniref:Uncharacterized protein n=1 Tax=Linnemannia hyalina TaxID=64524 RepID=A0A9P8BMI5_9FUNG|nr:hypothetical protein KI688_007578 [Linnemannia hyalina]